MRSPDLWSESFTAQAINRLIEEHDEGTLVFIGNRKRFRYKLYKDTEGITEAELAEFRPLAELILAENKSIIDALHKTAWRLKLGE